MPRPIKLMVPLTTAKMIRLARSASRDLGAADVMAHASRVEIGGVLGEQFIDGAIGHAIEGLAKLEKIKRSLGFNRRMKTKGGRS